MKARNILAVLTVLCLIFASVPALAAPTRDLQAVELTVDENMTNILEITVKAFLGSDWNGVLESAPNGGDQPVNNDDLSKADPILAQRTLAYAMAYTGEENALDDQQAQALIAQVYTDWQGTLPDSGSEKLLEKTDAGWALRREAMENKLQLGVYPYSVQFDGVNATVKADIFCCPAEYDVSAEEIPEDVLVWLLNGEFSLRFSPDALFGYTVNGYALSPFYQAGRTNTWEEAENTEFEYSVFVPSHLGLADDSPSRTVWQSADGTVMLTIEAEEGSLSFDEALAAFLQEHPGQEVIQERLFDIFYAFSEGSFTLITVSEALPWHYTVTFTFPAERQAEYEFYSEIIRNSFSVWGISNG